MDARGAELLLRRVGNPIDGESEAEAFGRPASPSDVDLPGAFVRRWLRFPSTARFARRSILHIAQASRAPIASLAPDGAARPGDAIDYRIVAFSEEETAAIDEAGERAGAGFRKSLFSLAATIRAIDAIRVRRGAPPLPMAIPVPIDLRRRGALGPTLSNHVTFLFFRVEPRQATSTGQVVSLLKEQMMDQMREGIPQSCATMMDLFRRVPLAAYARLVRRPSKGQIATFFFSDTGESCSGLETFLGHPVADAFHFAPVSRPPGVAVIFTRFRGRLAAVLSWAEGCLDESEQRLFEERLRAELLGEAGA